MKNDYTALDAAICDHIASGLGHPVNSRALEELARSMLAPNAKTHNAAWRMIDRRMQAMRKAGRLVYGHRRWIVQGEDSHATD